MGFKYALFLTILYFTEVTECCPIIPDTCNYGDFSDLPNQENRCPTCGQGQGCDKFLSLNTWYRFDFVITTSCPTHVGTCGSNYPIWMNGTFPDAIEGAVDRKSCLRTYESCCEKTFDLMVKNCTSHNLYCMKELPNGCNQRFCFDSPPLTNTTTAITKTMPTTTPSITTTKPHSTTTSAQHTTKQTTPSSTTIKPSSTTPTKPSSTTTTNLSATTTTKQPSTTTSKPYSTTPNKPVSTTTTNLASTTTTKPYSTTTTVQPTTPTPLSTAKTTTESRSTTKAAPPLPSPYSTTKSTPTTIKSPPTTTKSPSTTTKSSMKISSPQSLQPTSGTNKDCDSKRGDQLKETTASPPLPYSHEQCSCEGHVIIIVVLTSLIVALVLFFSFWRIKVYKQIRTSTSETPQRYVLYGNDKPPAYTSSVDLQESSDQTKKDKTTVEMVEHLDGKSTFENCNTKYSKK